MIRLAWKLFLRRFRCIPSFCKKCGRDVHDFIAPDWAWETVRPFIKRGNRRLQPGEDDVLCYDCFCTLCEQVDIWVTWRLCSEDDKPTLDNNDGCDL